MDARTQNSSEASQKGVLLEIESALKGMNKLLGAIRFYPSGHPALKDVARDAQQGFQPVLAGREKLMLQIRRDGFTFEEKPVPSENPMLQKLAGILFARRVQRLMILPDLSCRDLWNTAQALLVDAAELQKRGGLQEELHRAKVSTIWANVVDLSTILNRKEVLEREKATLYGEGGEEGDDEKFLASISEGATESAQSDLPGAGDATVEVAESSTLEELLAEIQCCSSDQKLATLFPQLPPLVRTNLKPEFAVHIWQAVNLTAENSVDQRYSPSRRDLATQTISQLATADILSYYLDLLGDRNLIDEQRSRGIRSAALFGESMTQLIMVRLADEADQAKRKIPIEILIQQGSAVLPIVVPMLQDERWQVARNAAAILGEVRDPDSVEHLKPLLQHADPRIKREAMRSLARIGGNQVVNILLRTLQQNDPELRRQAMLTLGAMKNPAAVPTLISYLNHPDSRVNLLEPKKDVIRALGEIGSTEALPPLCALALSSRFFFRSRHNELRVAAIAALGEIGGAEAVRVLEHLANGGGPVARAAAHALRQAKKVGKR